MAEPPHPTLQSVEDKRELVVLKIASQLEQINTAIEQLQDVLQFMATSLRKSLITSFTSDQWEFFAQVSVALASAHECLRRS